MNRSYLAFYYISNTKVSFDKYRHKISFSKYRPTVNFQSFVGKKMDTYDIFLISHATQFILKMNLGKTLLGVALVYSVG